MRGESRKNDNKLTFERECLLEVETMKQETYTVFVDRLFNYCILNKYRNNKN